MKIPFFLKRSLWAVFLLVFVFGLLDWIFATWVRVPTQFGDGPHPAQVWFLRIHGIAGLAFLPIIGALFSNHVLPGLKQNRRKVSGWTLLITMAILCLSVPFLYYLGDENAKHWVAVVHTYVGLVSILLITIHSTKFALRKTTKKKLRKSS